MCAGKGARAQPSPSPFTAPAPGRAVHLGILRRVCAGEGVTRVPRGGGRVNGPEKRLMARCDSGTIMRPIPRGRISRSEALAFGLVLAAGSVLIMSFAVNVASAALLAFTIFFYVVVYTLKRRTAQNIVIGGAAGAFPPVIGWAATTGGVGTEPLILFLIIFLAAEGRCAASRQVAQHGHADGAGRGRANGVPIQRSAQRGWVPN